MRTTTCILLLAAAAWGQQVAVPQGGSLGPSSRLSDAASMSADKVDGSHSSSTPGANTVPVTGSNGKLAPGWIPLPTSSSIGGIFMDADCLTGNHVSGIDAASGRLECSADAADWSTLANKPAAFPPDISSQAWQDLLAALALKAPQAALDEKLASSALDSTLIVSKFNGGACAGYLKSDGGCDTPSGSEGTPSLDETSVSGSVYSSKPFKVAGTQTDMEVVEGTPVEVAGENHWSVDSATHRPAYSYNGGIASKVAFVGDAVAAEDVSGLGDSATRNVGTGAGTVAAGDDSRITGAAPLNSPTFTGTVAGITQGMVGLGNVDNTTDLAKPISTATQTALDTKLASSALNSTLIVSKFGSGSCTGYLKNDGTCDTPGGTESTPALSEDSTSVNSSKPVAVTGTQTDFKVTEGTPVVVTGENHFSFNSATHHPAYSYNGGAARDVMLAGDASSYTLPAATASTLGGVKGTGSSLTCSGTQKATGFASDGTLQCGDDQTGSGGGSLAYWQSPSGNTSALGTVTSAKTILWGIYVPGSMTVNAICYHVQAADNSANVYDLGIYDNTGALVAHPGASAANTTVGGQATWLSTTGAKCISVTPATLAAGKAYLAITSSAASPSAILGGTSGVVLQFASHVQPATGSDTTGGALNSSIGVPADVWSNATQQMPNMGLH